ncbi:MAG: alanine--glyoxylate aminotransferase family protein [Anaerolineae bacterium]
MKPDHVKLFIPGPTEVRAEIRQAQAQPMIGHRGSAFTDLFARTQKKLRQVFYTAARVYLSTSSGTGLWEAASRNGIREGRKVLHVVNGAFSERWAYTSQANGKQVVAIELEWGCAARGEMIRDALRAGGFDAVAFVHNETSTGAMSPLEEIAQVMKEFPDVLFLVDAVSSAAGVRIEVDRLGVDMLVASSQKAFGLPPGLAFAPASDRMLARAKEVPYRGYYFDLLSLEKSLVKNETPTTPAISLMFALDRQLDDMLAEGLETRFNRHIQMAQMTQTWVRENGLELFPEPGFSSYTVTTVKNTRQIDVAALNTFLKGQGMQISNGYSQLKDKTFRIAHMGDTRCEEMQDLLTAMSAYLESARQG